MSARLLLVDDDPSVLRGLRRALTLTGYDVAAAEEGETALALADSQNFDLVVLDVMLPGLDGLTVCGRLRKRGSAPVLMLTAKDTVPDRVPARRRRRRLPREALRHRGALGTRAGAAPSQPGTPHRRPELRRRHPGHCHARSDPSGPTHQAYSHRISALGDVSPPPATGPLPQSTLSGCVGYDFDGESNFVDVAVKDLRKKLEAEGQPRLIQTLRGFGYALRKD